MSESIRGPSQSDTATEEYDQHDVWEWCRHVYNLQGKLRHLNIEYSKYKKIDQNLTFTFTKLFNP